MAVGKACRQQLAQGRILFEGGNHLVVDLVGLDELPALLGRLLGQYAPILQRPQPLEHDRGGGNRTQNDRPHQRATCPHNFPPPSDPKPLTTAGILQERRARSRRYVTNWMSLVSDAPGIRRATLPCAIVS